MKRLLVTLRCSAAMLLLGLASCAHGAKPPSPAAPTEVSLSQVAAQVTHTLDRFNAEATADTLPKLSKVIFDFNVAGTQNAGFSFNILIFKVGASREASTGNEVTFTYAVPAPPGSFGSRSQPATHDFSQALLSTLEAAALQVKTTQNIGAAHFANLTVTLSYAAVWEGTAGAGGTLELVTVDSSVDRKRSDVQTLTLVFGQ